MSGGAHRRYDYEIYPLTNYQAADIFVIPYGFTSIFPHSGGTPSNFPEFPGNLFGYLIQVARLVLKLSPAAGNE